MSEPRGNYSNSPPLTKAAFLNRSCTLPVVHPEYKPPTADEVQALMNYAGWTPEDVERLIGVLCDPAAEVGSGVPMLPYAAWRLLLLVAGVVTIEETRESLGHPFG